MMKIQLKTFVTAIGIISGMYTNAQHLITPEPTTASLQNYVNIGASPSTGVPSIDIPLYTLETDRKNIPVSLSLSYHSYNVNAGIPASEVGLGWSLFKGALISKENYSKNNEFTEINDLNKQNADHFYYNIPGHSGKFQIYKDPLTNNLKVYTLSDDKVKIEFIREQSSTKLIINSFAITDDAGTKYNFLNYNISSFREQQTGALKNQRTSYLITSIYDVNNNNLVNYSYDVKSKNVGTSLKYKINKLNTITTSKGKLKFDYNYDESADGNNTTTKDFYTLNSVSLLNNSNVVISKSQFIFENNDLRGLKKFDSENIESEQTYFSYSSGSDTQYGYHENSEMYGHQICPSGDTFENPQKYVNKLLSNIIFPTKGSVAYDYEANEIYQDRSNDNYAISTAYTEPLIQYFDISDNILFDTNGTREYTFTVSGASGNSYPIEIAASYEEDINSTSHPVAFSFSLRRSNNTVVPTDNSANSCPSTISQKFYKIEPGTYTIRISLWAGTGNFLVTQLKSLPKPYRNYDPVRAGVRIKKITYYDYNGVIQKQKKYEYNSFMDSNSSSGYLFEGENSLNLSEEEGYVVYKNVRETEIAGIANNGHTDYYYNTPYDYFTPTNGTWSYFNLTSNGILTAKKIYNSQNQLLENRNFIYNFVEIPNSDVQLTGNYLYKPSFIQNIKSTTVQKRGSADYTTIEESVYSLSNHQQILSKITTQDGNIVETATKYAEDFSDTRLINANMLSVPIETIIKDNGTILSSSKTIFGNINHFYPTSVESTDLNQVSETQMTFDLYDDKGNLIQATDKTGISTTTIWGYHKTLPIATITGAKYSDISSITAIAAAVNASDADDNDGSNEASLLTALENLRLDDVLKQYSINTFAYNPLIGVTHVISPNGGKVIYTYDASGRLSTVKDGNGKVLKENQYNYRHY